MTLEKGKLYLLIMTILIFFYILKESLFPARVIYDLLFFFIVIIIVLNLIFGVIIDTFADLRSEKQKKEEILKTTCFICGKHLEKGSSYTQQTSSKNLQGKKNTFSPFFGYKTFY